MKPKRSCGILLHISSLPGPYGLGDLGPSAYEFIDFLNDAGQSYWQLLPLNPTRRETDNSPYSSPSAFAGNPLLISPDLLVAKGYLSENELPAPGLFPLSSVDFSKAIDFKRELFEKLCKNKKIQKLIEVNLEKFRNESRDWLQDFCLYSVLKDHYKNKWYEWPEPLKRREQKALQHAKSQFRNEIYREELLQFIFFEQWTSLKRYAHEKGISLFGDLPLYVDGDSADCWSHPQFFQLDKELRPAVVSGVPPDLFSDTGQLWGSPVYDWKELRKAGYSWWISRLQQNLKLFDLVRIDHFRGFSSYWAIGAGENTAEKGEWRDAPGYDFFDHLKKEFPEVPFVAEDLGEIDEEVLKLRDEYQLPGMNILQYAFGGKEGEERFIPYRYQKNSVTYTGTHDNNTTVGWFRNTTPEVRNNLKNYLGGSVHSGNVHHRLMRLAYQSVSDLVIIPMQDILGLGGAAIMNEPGTASGNWTWRMATGELTPRSVDRLKKMAGIYGRDCYG